MKRRANSLSIGQLGATFRPRLGPLAPALAPPAAAATARDSSPGFLTPPTNRQHNRQHNRFCSVVGPSRPSLCRCTPRNRGRPTPPNQMGSPEEGGRPGDPDSAGPQGGGPSARRLSRPRSWPWNRSPPPPEGGEREGERTTTAPHPQAQG
jgi:hypothetical protein